ncbi:nitroreductase/quinone reductase family protein [Pseudonocardia xinjiangensis]|uniref:nitroreductase/quinone reductase family protein n=1 Tax=Pseudonocardia xinjiangensis TaxID=75289 RepID=UPI003D8FE7AE
MTVDDAVARALDIGPDSSTTERTIDITTLGRRSGIPRRIEVWFHRVDGHWYLTGMPVPRSWYANLRADPRFVVHLKHGVRADLPATARPVDESTRRRVITAVLDLQNRPEIAARVGRRQDLDDWLAHSPLVEIVFDHEQTLTKTLSTGEEYEVPHARSDRNPGQPLLPGHDDVRGHGKLRSR